jgi:hypothetical protein
MMDDKRPPNQHDPLPNEPTKPEQQAGQHAPQNDASAPAQRDQRIASGRMPLFRK